MQRFLTIGVIGVGLFASVPMFAQQGDADRPNVLATRLDGKAPPALDGKVDDEAWEAVNPYSTFTQQEPNDGQPATERTEVRFLFDATMLYIGVIAYDSEPDRIIVS